MPNVRASSGMIGTMRGSNLLVPQQLFECAHHGHGGRHFLVARPLLQRLVGVAAGQRQHLRLRSALRHEAAQRPAPVEHVADLGCVGSRVVVRRQVGVLLQFLVADRDANGVAELLEVFQRKLFHLVGGVAALEVGAQRIALDGLGQDHRRLALVLGRGAVGRVDLAVVMPAALEVPDLGVGHVSHQRLGARVAAEEVVAHVAAVVGLVGLVVAVGRGVHQVDQCAVTVGVQ